MSINERTLRSGVDPVVGITVNVRLARDLAVDFYKISSQGRREKVEKILKFLRQAKSLTTEKVAGLRGGFNPFSKKRFLLNLGLD